MNIEEIFKELDLIRIERNNINYDDSLSKDRKEAKLWQLWDEFNKILLLIPPKVKQGRFNLGFSVFGVPEQNIEGKYIAYELATLWLQADALADAFRTDWVRLERDKLLKENSKLLRVNKGLKVILLSIYCALMVIALAYSNFFN
jgi:hypothetical protein